MPLHIPALAAAAAAYVTAQDCEEPNSALEHIEENETDEEIPVEAVANGDSSFLNEMTTRSQRSVRFSQRSLATTLSCSSANVNSSGENRVRSLYSERSSIQLNEEIRLKVRNRLRDSLNGNFSCVSPY